MKKLRCTSCGAELKIDENKEYATCEHCGSKYKLNEDLNINIKMDDNVKEVINNSASKFSKVMLIPIIFFIIIAVFIGLFAYNSKKDFDNNVKENNEKIEEQKERMQEFNDEIIKSSFNFNFVSANGTKNGFFLKDILDKINENNKKYARKVSLVFNGNKTMDETEIINYKHGLNDSDQFEVMVNYDNDGYVYEIRVDNIR